MNSDEIEKNNTKNALRDIFPISFYEANCTNLEELSKDEEDLFSKMVNKSHFDKKRLICLSLANRKLWQDSIEQNKIICIVEDGLTLESDEILKIEKLIEEDFDIYFLNDVDVYNMIPLCYIIKPKGAKKLLWYMNNKGFRHDIYTEFRLIYKHEFQPFKVLKTNNKFFGKLNNL